MNYLYRFLGHAPSALVRSGTTINHDWVKDEGPLCGRSCRLPLFIEAVCNDVKETTTPLVLRVSLRYPRTQFRLSADWVVMKRSYRIAEVAIRVDDLQKASTFYQDVLGFEFHHSEPGVIFLEVGSLETPLGAVGHPQLFALFGRGNNIDVSLSTFDHIAFEIESKFYDQELARFKAMDMVIHERAWPETLPWDGRSFFFRGPEGNVIEIITANHSTAD